MTTTTLSTQHLSHEPSVLERILRVTRLMFTNKATLIGMPLMILAIIFTATYLIWLLVSANISRSGGTPDGTQIYVGGGSFFVVIYMLVAAVQAINQSFRFAQGYSVTRRDFYFGSALTFFATSLGFAILMSFLGWLEDLTSGWGLNGQMFSLRYLGVANTLEAFVFYFLTILLSSYVGMAVATLYVRWRTWGIVGFFTGGTFLVIGLIALCTFTNSWEAVWSWMATNRAVGIAVWSLLPTALAAVTGFFVLRRSTPSN